MKICVTGKGGSGKSMVSVLLARALAAKGYPVLLVDADESNLGLQRMLGMEEAPKPLMDYLGGKPALQRIMMAAFTSGPPDEPKMRILPDDSLNLADIPADYVGKADGISILKVGKIEHTMEGCACPMGALARDFLAKLVLGKDDVVITDMEAGVEHFGRGVEGGADAVLVIVDPSYESVLLADKIGSLSRELGLRVIVALNRVTEQVQDRLTEALARKGITVDGCIPFDDQVFQACLTGQPLSDSEAGRKIAELAGVLGL